jgi:hypothetical protein
MAEKKSFWSPWIPYAGSWLSAMLLGLLSIGGGDDTIYSVRPGSNLTWSHAICGF